MLPQSYYIIIYRDVIAPGHGREVVDGLINTETWFLFQLMVTVQLEGSKGYDTQMLMDYENSTTDVSLSQEFQKRLYNVACKHGVIDQGKLKKR